MANHRIAVIGGDGISPEVTGAACEVLDEPQSIFPELRLEFSESDWGFECYLKEGNFPQSQKKNFRSANSSNPFLISSDRGAIG